MGKVWPSAIAAEQAQGSSRTGACEKGSLDLGDATAKAAVAAIREAVAVAVAAVREPVPAEAAVAANGLRRRPSTCEKPRLRNDSVPNLRLARLVDEVVAAAEPVVQPAAVHAVALDTVVRHDGHGCGRGQQAGRSFVSYAGRRVPGYRQTGLAAGSEPCRWPREPRPCSRV